MFPPITSCPHPCPPISVPSGGSGGTWGGLEGSVGPACVFISVWTPGIMKNTPVSSCPPRSPPCPPRFPLYPLVPQRPPHLCPLRGLWGGPGGSVDSACVFVSVWTPGIMKNTPIDSAAQLRLRQMGHDRPRSIAGPAYKVSSNESISTKFSIFQGPFAERRISSFVKILLSIAAAI